METTFNWNKWKSCQIVRFFTRFLTFFDFSDLKAPVLGVQRHSNFKELRKPFRVSKPKYSTVSLVCMSDSIPLSSILWVRNDEVISKSNYLTIKNATISDSGKYRCLAANTIGTKYSELKLRIHWLIEMQLLKRIFRAPP